MNEDRSITIASGLFRTARENNSLLYEYFIKNLCSCEVGPLAKNKYRYSADMARLCRSISKSTLAVVISIVSTSLNEGDTLQNGGFFFNFQHIRSFCPLLKQGHKQEERYKIN